MKIIYRVHAVERMFERDISEEVVEEIIKDGKIIEEYPEDQPYPSFLVLGFEKGESNKPVHVVYAENGAEVIVITVYRPDTSKWGENFKERLPR